MECFKRVIHVISYAAHISKPIVYVFSSLLLFTSQQIRLLGERFVCLFVCLLSPHKVTARLTIHKSVNYICAVGSC